MLRYSCVSHVFGMSQAPVTKRNERGNKFILNNKQKSNIIFGLTGGDSVTKAQLSNIIFGLTGGTR